MTSFTNVFTGSTIYPSEVALTRLDLVANVQLYWPVEAPDGQPTAAEIVEIDSTTGSWSITLPDATQVSVGQTILFNNLTGDTVTVKNATGATVVSVTAGNQWQIYLYDNTTASGLWRIYQFGAATSTANAAALAGPGLKASGSVLETKIAPYNKTTNYTLVNADRAAFYNWTGALGTFTLPEAISVGADWYVNVRNSGTGDLTIGPWGPELINGSTSLTLAIGDSATFITNGTNWYTLGLGQSATFAFDYVVINVSGNNNYTLSGNELNRIAYQFIGTVTADIRIVVPFTTQQYWVYNNTTGGHTVSIATFTQPTPLPMVNGTRTIVYCDGTTVVPAVTSYIVGAVDGGSF